MAIRTLSGVSYTSVGQKIKRILDHYPGNHGNLYITSSYRPHTPGSHHGGRFSYGGSGTAAVDIGSPMPDTPGHMRKLAAWLMQFSGDTVELIHSSGNYFVKNGRRVGSNYYSSATKNAHYNHVHLAMSSAQADRVLRKLGSSGATTGGSGGSGGGVPAGAVRSAKEQQEGHNYLRYLLKQSYRLAEDGVFGPKTEANVKWLQEKVGVAQDGVWGPATESAYMKMVNKLKGTDSNTGGSSTGGSSGKLSVDGVNGPNTISEMQRQLNKKR